MKLPGIHFPLTHAWLTNIPRDSDSTLSSRHVTSQVAAARDFDKNFGRRFDSHPAHGGSYPWSRQRLNLFIVSHRSAAKQTPGWPKQSCGGQLRRIAAVTRLNPQELPRSLGGTAGTLVWFLSCRFLQPSDFRGKETARCWLRFRVLRSCACAVGVISSSYGMIRQSHLSDNAPQALAATSF